MTQRKYKVTGFTRFVLFMMVFAPLAYLGITTLQGKSAATLMTEIKSKVAEWQGKNKEQNDAQETDIIARKDAEIQQLREALFQCEKSKNGE